MMDEGFIVDLPLEANDTNFSFNVHAPSGGFAGPLMDLQEGRISHIDLDVRHDYTHATFRIIPGGNISQDPRNQARFHVSDGYGTFLDELGNEHGDMISFGGYLEIEATNAGSLSGVLNLWKRSLPGISAAS